MPESPKIYLLIGFITLVCWVNLFTYRGAIYPGIMEARNLITASEMVSKNNWLMPTMNDYPRLAKPPLPTWINGLVARIYPVSNLSAHRVPPALAAVLMIASIMGICWVVSGQFRAGFIAGCLGATAFYILLMGRQASWDIYCHAFMSVSIFFLVLAWARNRAIWRSHILAGLFMGLSFLSKGPVAHYAMLLPFLVSWIVFIQPATLRRFWKPILAFAIVGLAIGAAWPAFVFFQEPELFTATMSREVTAWSERHVRPFYQYWGFWGHIGIWAIFTLATFIYGKMVRRLTRREYLFLLTWTLLTVILLSIPAEKKERYLLPVLTPMIVLTAFYLDHLYHSWKTAGLKHFDFGVIRFNSFIMILSCLAVPVFLTMRMNVETLVWIIYVLLAGCFIYWTFLRLRPDILFFLMILLMTLTSLIILPRLDQLIYLNSRFQSLYQVRYASYYSMDFYSENLNPVQIWELGKSVDTLHVHNEKFIIPQQGEFIILTEDKVRKSSFRKKIETIELIDSLYFDPENEDRLMYVLKIIPE